ncbi:MAG: YqhA family protein [Theionarchaea archaeon]|nr:YqhA family protein [Theionarchaea archaeon]
MDLEMKKLLTGKTLHRLVLASFKWGKYVIIYGSILLLTVLGFVAWIFGALGSFSFVWQSTKKWGFSNEPTARVLEYFQTKAIILLDLFLLSVVLFIIAIGLYGIFIRKEEGGIKLPVNITRMSELERYLFGTIAAILLVNALNEILLGSATYGKIGMICAVVLVISIYLAAQNSNDQQQNSTSKER